MSENYDVYSGFGIAATITPRTGTYTNQAITCDGMHDTKLPGRKVNKGNWTPLTGDQAGIQQAVPGSIPREALSFKTPYQPGRETVLDTICKEKAVCDIVTLMADGKQYTYVGFLDDVRKDNITDAPPLMISVSADVAGDWTALTTTIAAFSQALSVGAASMDLTAIPLAGGGTVDGTGKHVKAIALLAPSTNANAITLAKGASSGYAGLGATFSIVLAAGQDAKVVPVAAAAVIGTGNKTLDLSGTGSQVLTGVIWMA
jgi:hypothetical protein